MQQTAEISIYVHNNFQGQGVGSKLLQHAETDCVRLGIQTLFAIIIDTNVNSIRIMEKHGYEKWGHLPRIAKFGGIEVGHVYYGKRL